MRSFMGSTFQNRLLNPSESQIHIIIQGKKPCEKMPCSRDAQD